MWPRNLPHTAPPGPHQSEGLHRGELTPALPEPLAKWPSSPASLSSPSIHLHPPRALTLGCSRHPKCLQLGSPGAQSPMAGGLAPGRRRRRWADGGGGGALTPSSKAPTSCAGRTLGGQLQGSAVPQPLRLGLGPGWVGPLWGSFFLLPSWAESSPKLPGERKRASWKATPCGPHSVMEKMGFNSYQS